MTMTVDATYENGTLKLERPLPIKEHERVRVTIQTGCSLTRQTAAMIGWQGNVEAFDGIYAEAQESGQLP